MHILRQSELDGMPCPDTLIHGDCLEAMKYIADGSIDMICADLPYGTTACTWDTVIPFEPLWEVYRRVIKPNGAIVLFGSQPFTTDLIQSNRAWFKYCWVWEKSMCSGFMHAKNKPLKIHEDICIFSDGTTVHFSQSKKRMTYNPQGLKADEKYFFRPNRDEKISNGTVGHRPSHVKGWIQEHTGYPKSVLRFPNPNHDLIHPTQKPIALIEYMINTYTNPGDLVLDNVMGSAALPVACLNTGRHFIGIEKDDAYFAASVERVKAALAQQAFAFNAPPSV